MCRDCGCDGWSDLMALAAPAVRDDLLAPLQQDAPLQLTSDQVMDIILRCALDPT